MLDFFKALAYNADSPLVFNSVLFFILFTAFYGVYINLFERIRVRNILLLAFSLYFYYKISGFFVFLLVLMATSDFFLGKAIFNSQTDKRKKLFVAISVIVNIGALCYFKYTNFFIQSWFGLQGVESPILLNIVMPVGISFFVFKSLSYIFDLNREMIEEPENNYLDYVLYVSFFPNILAGPISKARNLLPQFKQQFVLTEEMVGKAIFLILTGAFKKVFIADYLAANFVDRVFDGPNFFTGFENLMASFGAMIQIYADFSGYTDIVIGIALLLGIVVEPNFNKPFLAKNITDFWRRWHMTLAQWLNEYLFYPLTYNLRTLKKVGVIIAVFVTFFVSGFWHGASWTFVLWGCSHGLALIWDIISEGFRDGMKKVIPKKVYVFFSVFLTFIFLSLSVVLFKSADLKTAGLVYAKIFTDLNFSLVGQWISLYSKPFMLMVLAIALHFTPMTWNNYLVTKYSKMSVWMKAILAFIAILIIYQAYSSDALPFVYLEF